MGKGREEGEERVRRKGEEMGFWEGETREMESEEGEELKEVAYIKIIIINYIKF